LRLPGFVRAGDQGGHNREARRDHNVANKPRGKAGWRICCPLAFCCACLWAGAVAAVGVRVRERGRGGSAMEAPNRPTSVNCYPNPQVHQVSFPIRAFFSQPSVRLCARHQTETSARRPHRTDVGRRRPDPR